MTDSHTPTTIDCSGDMTVNRIEEIYDRLRAGLNAGGPVAVDCRAAAEADVSFIQLLIAARVSAQRRGMALRLMQPLAEPLRSALERGGFTAGTGAPDADFWTGGL